VRKLLAGVVASGLVVGALATLAPTAADVLPDLGLVSGPGQDASGTTPGAAQDPSPLSWAACAGDLGTQGVECATLKVPLDHDQPEGTKIDLALSRVKHTVPDDKYQGVMLVNPGGPGVAGLAMATLGRRVPFKAGEAYDWIGFDPRGVGASKPTLTCGTDDSTDRLPPYIPVNAADEQTRLAWAKGYADRCGKNSGALLEHVKTVDVAKDVELMRLALGEKQINYYGLSYGTYLGEVYSTLYPKNVRKMIFDGTVDPSKIWYQYRFDQDAAFEKVIQVWFGWVAKNDSTYKLGGTADEVQKRFYTEQGKLYETPAKGVVGGNEWIDLFLQAGYSQGNWTRLADVFSKWANTKDGDALLKAFQSDGTGGGENFYAAFSAVQCTDAQWPQEWQTWKDDNSRVFNQAPFYTWANAWTNTPCLTWPAKAGQPVDVNGGDVAEVLMINETLDAATPYSGSLEVRKRYPGARLIAVPDGTTHAGSLGGNACVNDKIIAYLATGDLPQRLPGDTADVECAALPQPVPGAAPADRTGPGEVANPAVRGALRP
jgi:pimeloyl-ACP methyl ester carboxylesterase